MSQDHQLSFFNFDNMSDTDRQIVQSILHDRIIQSKAVQLPWKEELYECLTDNNCGHAAGIPSGEHSCQIMLPPNVSQCGDMTSLCLPAAQFYAPPVYVLIDPSAGTPPSLFYQGVTSGSMVAPTVLTSAGYMTPLGQIIPQMLAPNMMQTAQSPSLVQPLLPRMIHQPAAPGIMIPSAVMTPAVSILPTAAGVLSPHGALLPDHINTTVASHISIAEHNQVAFPVLPSPASEPPIRHNADGLQMPQSSECAPVVTAVGCPDHLLPSVDDDACNMFDGDRFASSASPGPAVEAASDVSKDAVLLPDAEHDVTSHGSCGSPPTNVDDGHELTFFASHSDFELPAESCVVVSPVEEQHPVETHPDTDSSSSSFDTQKNACITNDVAALNNNEKASLDVNENGQWPAINQQSKQASSGCNLPGKPKVPSWASLLRDTTAATNAIVINADDRHASHHRAADGKAALGAAGNAESASAADLSVDKVQKLQIGELLKSHKLCHRSVHIQPRGLTNRGNWCYVNATLQALLACPPFYHLMKLLPQLHEKFQKDKSIAVMRSMIEFVGNFSVKQVKGFEKQSENSKGNVKLDIKCGVPFEPVQVYEMLQLIDYEAFKHGQQEDAEEFLSCILNRLHDEMVAVMKLSDKDKLNGGDVCFGNEVHGPVTGNSIDMDGDTSAIDNRWEQVKSRSRTVFNSMADSESSPISAMFRGQICSILHQLGQKESATLQSFFTLQLDVQNENVKSVKDALEQLVSKESLQGYTCTKSKVEVDATQRLLLEELPPVLVLHLKWFIYDKNGGMQKCIKQVDFDIDLELGKDLLSAHAKSKCPLSHRKYKLFAVVKHIGARAIGGHYTVDVFHPGYNCWLHCDDNNVTSIPTSSVTKFTAPKVPYLIFYRRLEPS